MIYKNPNTSPSKKCDKTKQFLFPLSVLNTWAGTFRKTDKNIGVLSYAISIAFKALLDDCTYWIENNTFSHDEIAVRFKHHIVTIHCFANGNGRHSRLMADLIAEKVFDEKVFNWGRNNLAKPGKERSTYLSTIYEADKGNYMPLIKFARS